MVSVGTYTYVEPGAPRISIHGVKVGGEYTGSVMLDRRRHWFVQADAGTIRQRQRWLCSPCQHA
jgi:hypothetical protein